ncbi:LVIVD repeat-containing protein [Natrialba sp. SSL1]|uniref:LVIVD repeat-containing protein n=1 Tax=Natrialba sp. SSL1 TaxID=1869245 RepID=UPI0008F92178|nr:hypothetical protein [Natrialba sp. SSL1]OIB56237.1 hypothetical protein BBD46_18940 [Natrialba sp. SSL1]
MRRRAFLRSGLTAGVGLSVALSASSVSATDERIPSHASVATGSQSTITTITPDSFFEEPVESTPQDAFPDSYEPLGRTSVGGAAEAVVGDDGETAYLATTTGFATVDVSDPTDPEVLAREDSLSVDDETLTDILDIKVSGDRLVVPGPANPTTAPVFHGFICYDVSDPAEPVAVTEPYETDYHIHNCFLEDNLLYVVANSEEPAENPLVVFDISDDTVEAVGRWSLLEFEPGWEEVHWLLRYLHDVYVHDEIAYLAYWNAGTYLIDVSDPANPEYISHVAETELEEQQNIPVAGVSDAQQGLPGNDHYSAVDDTGTLLGVGREAWATGGDDPDGPGGIDLYDVSEPSEPTYQATIEAPSAENEGYSDGMWTTAHNFELRNDRLYASWYRGGVTVHDVSDPASPTELAGWRDADDLGFWTARVLESGETFIASSTEAIPSADTEGALLVFPAQTDGAGSGGDDGDDDDEDGTVGSDAADSIPGFTAPAVAGAAGVAGGALGLEVLRRRSDAETESSQQ